MHVKRGLFPVWGIDRITRLLLNCEYETPAVLYKVNNMLRSIFEALRRRRDNRLYRQWVQHYDLPPRRVMPDLPSRDVRPDLPKDKEGNLHQQWVEEGSLAPEDVPQDEIPGVKTPEHSDTDLAQRFIRYIFYEALIIASLIVALAVVLTILVMKSC